MNVKIAAVKHLTLSQTPPAGLCDLDQKEKTHFDLPHESFKTHGRRRGGLITAPTSKTGVCVFRAGHARLSPPLGDPKIVGIFVERLSPREENTTPQS